MTSATDQDHMENTDHMPPTEHSGHMNSEAVNLAERGDLRGEPLSPSPGAPGDAAVEPATGTTGGAATATTAVVVPEHRAEDHGPRSAPGVAAVGTDAGGRSPRAEDGGADDDEARGAGPARRRLARGRGEDGAQEPQLRGLTPDAVREWEAACEREAVREREVSRDREVTRDREAIRERGAIREREVVRARDAGRVRDARVAEQDTGPEASAPGGSLDVDVDVDVDVDADAHSGRRARPSRRTPRQPGPSDETPPRHRTGADTGGDADADIDPAEAWDDGLIARRVTEAAAAALAAERETDNRGQGSNPPPPLAYDGPLRSRLDALRELVGLSRARLDTVTLAEAGRVLEEAAARRKLSGRHTVIAIAGATGSGKSQLFNALAGVAISETGVRRPTTAAPIACSWSDGAAGLIDRLGIPGRLRRRPAHNPDNEAELRGLVLVDLPDHDSAALQHREQVDRILKLVDAVIWVVDPEKYADAVLHERYLRPMAGHAEIMFVVLNQVDRLPGEAADQVLDDLRRLLDEDGIAVGEHGDPGANVLALSALTGEGVGELREALGQFVAERGAAARRVAADVDAAASDLRPVYAAERRAGLSEEAREEFAGRLADAVGATAAGDAAERAWLRNAGRACGTPWLRLWRWYQGRGDATTGRHAVRPQAEEEITARQRVEQAVRTVADRASAGLPGPWAQAVREAAVRGSQGLSEALDELAARAGLPPGRPPRPGWWPVAVLVQAAMTLLQIVGGLWLAGQIAGVVGPNLGVPVLLMVCGIIGGPLVEWSCRMAARGPARRYGQEAERRLREAAAGCGRARVLDPVAAELLRYREVRGQYSRVVRTGSGVGVS
ncbi:ATP-binding protein [Streptomyces yokosukanensis]|uniref:ATP-binding protein n=1 Tax=Streptomyces yokosukanensis TaxID=67386 RepID=A0A101NUN4_9ACTN|nr:GTPase [Streptomyces yokosukanensis]KUM99688.1 ATP-binding protein [Streptomyces yokosukanensis]